MFSPKATGRCAAGAACIILSSALLACGPAAKSPYLFSAVADQIPLREESVVDVRLTHEPTNKLVENAVIFETRFDMEPDAMGEMTGKVTSQGSPSPGIYRFTVKPTMGGRWALKLGAKVQGEAETVRGSVILTAH